MTNPGLPPVLSRSRHELAAEAAEALRQDLEQLLADVDAVLAETQGESAGATATDYVQHGTATAA